MSGDFSSNMPSQMPSSDTISKAPPELAPNFCKRHNSRSSAWRSIFCKHSIVLGVAASARRGDRSDVTTRKDSRARPRADYARKSARATENNQTLGFSHTMEWCAVTCRYEHNHTFLRRFTLTSARPGSRKQKAPGLHILHIRYFELRYSGIDKSFGLHALCRKL